MAKRYLNGELKTAMSKSDGVRIRVKKCRARSAKNLMCLEVEVEKDFLPRLLSALLKEDVSEAECRKVLERTPEELVKPFFEALAKSYRLKSSWRPNRPN